MRGSLPHLIAAAAVLVISTLLFVQFGGLTFVFTMGFGKNFHASTIQGTTDTPPAPAAKVPAPTTTPAPAATPVPAPASSQDKALLAVLGKMAEMSQLQSEAVANQTKALQRQTEAFNQLREQLASRPEPEQHQHARGCSHHSEWSKPVRRYPQ